MMSQKGELDSRPREQMVQFERILRKFAGEKGDLRDPISSGAGVFSVGRFFNL